MNPFFDVEQVPLYKSGGICNIFWESAMLFTTELLTLRFVLVKTPLVVVSIEAVVVVDIVEGFVGLVDRVVDGFVAVDNNDVDTCGVVVVTSMLVIHRVTGEAAMWQINFSCIFSLKIISKKLHYVRAL